MRALHVVPATLTAQVRWRPDLANNLSSLQLDLTDEEFRVPAAADAHRRRRGELRARAGTTSPGRRFRQSTYGISR